MKKIAIIGTGYVGLVTGTCFAELGNHVTCMDVDAKKIEAMKQGIVPIYEPGLEELFLRNSKAQRLQFTNDLATALDGASIVFLALPTPPGEDGSADLSYVLGVADELGPLLKDFTVIIDKSTVPVGTAEEVRTRIAAKATARFAVVSNPEFLREGFAVQDFMQPNRVVIGTDSPEAETAMRELYEPITDADHPLLIMSERSAELTKYAANSFLAMKITFMNQIANLCERVGADVDDVRRGVGTDERIGHRFLYPGIGYGGSCFPKDVIALIHTAKDAGYDFGLLQTVIDNNKAQQQLLAQKVLSYYHNDVRGKKFALWGLAFKPNTDDIREAPAIGVIETLTKAGATITAYDPEAMNNTKSQYAAITGLEFADDEFAALSGADALLVVTEWKQFSGTPLDRIKTSLTSPVVFDGRNIFDLDDMRRSGFYYESIGRPIVQLP